MIRKLFVFILILLLVLGAGFAYFTFFAPKRTPTLEPVVPVTQNNPFSLGGEGTLSTSEIPTTTSTTSSNLSITQNQALIHLTTEPVSGAAVVEVQKSFVVRYNDRKTGHFFDVNTETGTLNRISNTTLPNIYQSLWVKAGDKGVLRYLKTSTNSVESYFFKLATLNSTVSKISTSTPAGIAYGYYLPRDVSTIAVSPTSAKIFYTTNTAEGSKGIIENGDTQKQSTLFTSPFREWAATWPADNLITLTTKAASDIPGYLYFVNAQTGSMKEVIRGVAGLTTLTNPGGTTILYSDDTPSLRIFNVKTGTSTNIGLVTLPEKCVWSRQNKNTVLCAGSLDAKSGSFPDSWYQGTAAFTDSVYSINTQTGNITLINNPNETYGKNFDMINLLLSPTEDTLIFTNKNDGTLWALKLR